MKKTKTYLFRSPFELVQSCCQFLPPLLTLKKNSAHQLCIRSVDSLVKKGLLLDESAIVVKNRENLECCDSVARSSGHFTSNLKMSPIRPRNEISRNQASIPEILAFFIFSEKISENRTHCMIYRETPNRVF